FQEMMENLRVTEGQSGQGEGSPGQQAMEGLADTLREQQGLSDQAFRDLQEQFNPGTGTGEGRGGEDQGSEGDLAGRQDALRKKLESQRDALPGSGEAGDAARGALE